MTLPMGAALHRLPRLRARAWALIAVLLVAALTGGWFWLRDSGLAKVHNVTIAGISGSEAPAIRNALDQAAKEMTTLHVDAGRLRRAVAAYPQVKDLKVEAKPLHDLQIDVVERLPVATIDAGGQRVPVAADGTLLRGRVSSADLPDIKATALPAGATVTDKSQLRLLGVLAGAPEAMRKHVARVEVARTELIAVLRGNGPQIVLGDAARPRAKWVAAARVLGDDSSRGATYIDVRLPERPAAGGFTDETLNQDSASTGA
jgi:cell division protein FtsQ